MKAVRSALTLIIAFSVLLIGCDNSPDIPSANNPDPYFMHDVATAEAGGYPVYWLGWEFAAGDLTFYGPYGSGTGGEVEGGGADFGYLAPVQPGNIDLQLVTYTRAAWELAKERITNPKIPGETRPVTRRSVAVKGRQADLLSLPGLTRPVNQLWLIVDMGDAVVLARAPSVGPATPGGPEGSPFINNPDLLVQVMKDLRPYPE